MACLLPQWRPPMSVWEPVSPDNEYSVRDKQLENDVFALCGSDASSRPENAGPLGRLEIAKGQRVELGSLHMRAVWRLGIWEFCRVKTLVPHHFPSHYELLSEFRPLLRGQAVDWKCVPRWL